MITRISRHRRRGSALVIVLGVLSVLMLMAIAFSTFVRTERGGSTNLKNAFVARSSLDTALGRVMEAIDLAFGSADNDDPVAPWPYPWLASAENGDRYQCDKLGADETVGAQVLTAEIAKYLTPAQLALAKSAKCNWAPIHSSISASPASPERSGRDWGGYGRPSEDSLIGRYAFIALDTTGLLDMNNDGGGTAAERKATSGGDPLSLMIPNGAGTDSDGTDVPRFVKSPSTFVSKRNSSKMFYSMADARKECGTSVFTTDRPTVDGGYYPADLFAGFAPSLAELDPEGNPKIFLPSSSEFYGYNAGAVKALARRVCRAMVAIFARSRVAAGIGANKEAEKDTMKIFQSARPDSTSYTLSRSALAVVSLLDGLDADHIPGMADKQSVNYWKLVKDVFSDLSENNPDNPVKVDGVTVRPVAPSTDNPLNFPCTESSALFNDVAMWITFDDEPVEDDSDPNWENWTQTWEGTLHLRARAICQNRNTSSESHSADMKIEFVALEGTPDPNYVSFTTETDIREEQLEMEGDGGRTGGEKTIDWSDFFDKFGGRPKSVEGSGNFKDNRSAPGLIDIEEEWTFSVVCKAQSYDENGGGRTGGGATYYPLTQAEYNEEGGDVFIPIRIKATIKDGNGNVQQVPAPALESAKKDAYWICVRPGVYHGPDSNFNGGNVNGSLGALSYGWAICAAPMFAFDTTSLISPDSNEMNFWINDAAAMESGGGVGRQGGGNQKFVDLYDEFFAANNANDNVEAAQTGPRGQTVWNFLQINWLFDTDNDPNHERINEWLDYGKHVPDMMHRCTSKKNGLEDPTYNKPFVVSDGSVSSGRLALELFSRIPSGGYASVGDLGTVICGPYETLSLFKTWRLDDDHPVSDFHPVIDYFTTSDDRYPARKDITANTGTDGEVDWGALSGSGSSSDPYKDLYSAVHNGRVNLNAPPLVEADKIAPDGVSVRGRPSSFLNPYPLAAVLNGAPYPASALNGSPTTNAVTEAVALQLAADFCYTVEETDLEEMTAKSSCFNDHIRKVVRNLSAIGQSVGNENKFLEHFVKMAKPKCDAEREGLLGGIVDGLTTRGQTYLVIIRADAYSPRFGEQESVRDGTTLATTHAIVELFRDPIPARAPDGSLPSDGQRPVAYHNWYVRSFRVF